MKSNFLKAFKENSGITLVTLVITVIMMLILAGITISSIQDDGTTEYAENTAENFSQGIAGLEEYKNWLETQDDRLPSEYKEVEYIESTGTQYIDTGVQAYQNTAVEFKIASMSQQVTTWPVLFGAQVYDDGRNRFGISYKFIARTGSSSFGPSSITYDEPHVGRLELDKYTLDGVTYTATSAWVDPGISIYLFSINDAKKPGRTDCAAVARFYYFKIYQGTKLVRDLIPCYRKSDNVAGMYDTVNKVFYTNNGTGTFIVGNNV